MIDKGKEDITLKSLDKKILISAYDEVSSVLNLSDTILKEPNKEKVLYKVCLIVWDNISINHVPVETVDLKKGSFHDRIEQICYKAEVRFQKITLKGKWWKKDGGGMVGLLQSENRPVGLTRENGNYYVVDCYEGTKEKVSEKNAKSIHPTCYVFYPILTGDNFNGFNILKIILKGEFRNVATILFYFTLTLLFGVCLPLANKLFFDTIIPNIDIPLFVQLIIGLTSVACLGAIFTYLNSLIFLKVQAIMNSRFQSIQWDLLFRMPSKFFHKYSAGDLTQRMGGARKAWEKMGQNGVTMVFSGVISLVYIIPMAYLDFKFSLFVVGIVTAFLIPVLFVLPKMFSLHYNNLKVASWLNMAQLNIFSNVGQLRLYQAEKRAFAYWSKMFAKSVRYEFELGNIGAVIDSGLMSLRSILFFSLLCTFYFFYLQNGIAGFSVGTFIGLQSALGVFSMSIFRSIDAVIENVELYASWKLMDSLFSGITEQKHHGTVRVAIEGNIEVKNLSFRYEEDGEYIVQDVSFEVKAKEFLAITGNSGVGKSTILRLLAKMEEPDKGMIYYEKIELQHINKLSFKSQVAIVLQTSDIITGTLLENITLGRDVSREEVHKAIEFAGFTKDLENLPMGLETFMMMGGRLFSIGQQQKLMLARALVVNPKVLILDEATSGIYWKDQDLLFDKLRQKGLTIIAISHDSNLLAKADRVITI